ncbi:uncharacterized protein K02A2.6 [Neoarius graeffei]|uniref:uncharacterized protein K02A2.6 n=1 Tax=Neoarius graeffei TaxID=443677 RepID=UPI00298BE11E|nr:uncharacterized protein K02A2.6 [Neoarius graeffei]
MAGAIGNIDAFDNSVEEWDTYIERLEQYCVANHIENDRKVAVLLSVMGAKTYNLLRSLCAPQKPSAKSFKDIIKLLQDRFNPKPLVIAERFRFHNRNQQRNESISNYIAELRKLAEHCQFGAGLSDSLRDRLVCSMHNESIQRRLLTEKDLTLQKALELAIAMETASKDAMELQKKVTNEAHSVNKFTAKSTKANACFRCGKGSHDQADCWFRDKNCMKCNRKGHIQRMCKKKGNEEKQRTWKKDKKVNEMNDTDASGSASDETDNGLGHIELHSMTESDKKMIWVTPKINGKKLKMELDTGSAISLISLKDYKQNFADVKLKQTPILLKTYTGEKVAPVGKIKVKYENKRKTLDLYVLQRGGVPLFGRDWLQMIQLNWQSIKAMQHSENGNSKATQEKLNLLLQRAAPVFQEGIGTLKQMKARVTVDEHASPKFLKARPVPYALRPRVETELQRLEDQGILSKVESSDWATPVVPVVKKNGAIRLCGDFKVTINPVLHADKYLLPRIEDIFASLAGGQHFSKIDLAQAYLQMEMDAESKKYLTINTHKGLFQYNRLVFGIASTPAVWQRAIDQVLQGIPGTQCYSDDIIVTGQDDSSHLANLEAVLSRLAECGLRANKDKCEFFKDSIECCGHRIDRDGLHKSQDKIDAVLKAPKPTNVSQLRSLLGLVNYYHKFLLNLATVLHPLNNLLQTKVTWKWTKSCDMAFKSVKELITSDRVLTHYNPDLPLRLACDASPYGIGAVLSHKMPDGSERPIAFASRSLCAAEKNYAQIDREGLSLVWGVKKFNQYLYGKRFTLITDHQPLVAIFNPRKSIPAMTAARLQRWALFLGGHDCVIEYKGTLQHAHVENLPVTSAQIKQETSRDPTMAKVFELTVKGWPAKNTVGLPEYFSRREQLSVCLGCIMWGTRIVVPPKLRCNVLEALHEGHMGVVKMKSLARSYIWWPGIDQQMEDMAKTCFGCQQTQKQPPPAPVHSWEWPTAPWQRIHVDYAGPFLDCMFLVVVDAYSKWPEVFIVKNATTTKTVEVLHTLFVRTGLPERLVSDNGSQFTSEEFQSFIRRNGIKHTTAVPYHPATNGLAERSVQSFKQSMKTMSNSHMSLQEKMAKFLHAYRNADHATTGQALAVLFMGR